MPSDLIWAIFPTFRPNSKPPCLSCFSGWIPLLYNYMQDDTVSVLKPSVSVEDGRKGTAAEEAGASPAATGQFHPLNPRQIERVAETFKVLGEPTRLQLLHALQNGPRSVGALVEATGLKQANVSKQLGILYQAGLTGRRRDGTTVNYFISDPIIFDLCDLVCDKVRRHAHALAAIPSR